MQPRMSDPQLSVIEAKGEDKGLPYEFKLQVKLADPNAPRDTDGDGIPDAVTAPETATAPAGGTAPAGTTAPSNAAPATPAPAAPATRATAAPAPASTTPGGKS